MVLLVPRFSLPSKRPLMHSLRSALARAGGYTVALDGERSCFDVFMDVVFFHVDIQSGEREAASFARTLLESVDPDFCVVMEGKDARLTTNATAWIERVLAGATAVVMGAVWRTERPRANPGRWSELFHRFTSFLSTKESPPLVLSGMFVIEAGSAPTTGASYFLRKTRS